MQRHQYSGFVSGEQKKWRGLLLLSLVLVALLAYLWLIGPPPDDAALDASLGPNQLVSNNPTLASRVVVVNGDLTMEFRRDLRNSC